MLNSQYARPIIVLYIARQVHSAILYHVSDYVVADEWFERTHRAAEAVFKPDGMFVRCICWGDLPESGVWSMARICLGEFCTERILSKMPVAKGMMAPTQFDLNKYRAFYPSAIERV